PPLQPPAADRRDDQPAAGGNRPADLVALVRRDALPDRPARHGRLPGPGGARAARADAADYARTDTSPLTSRSTEPSARPIPRARGYARIDTSPLTTRSTEPSARSITRAPSGSTSRARPP